MIKTQNFTISRNEYFRVLAGEYFRKRWWVFVICYLIPLVFQFESGYAFILVYGTLIGVVYSLFILLVCWVSALTFKHKMFFSEMHYEIDDEFISVFMEDGSESKIKMDNIDKTIKVKQFYLLYISNRQFLVLPFKAFSSSPDLQQLDELLKRKGLLKQ